MAVKSMVFCWRLKNNMAILEETQRDRDLELAKILNKPLSYVQQLGVCTPDSIRIFDEKSHVKVENDFLSLYREYNFLDLDAYLKTTMFTSVERRGAMLKKLINGTTNKRCLDFGSGVGTHAIALLENGNDVDILDVEGQLLRFTRERIKRRGFKVNVFYHDSVLPENEYDVVICADVLEHVYDPLKEFKRICLSIKQNGKLFLEVSKKIKPSSGHFAYSINLWKRSGVAVLNKLFINIGKNLYIAK